VSLVIYDTETTGTDTFFDQILQFAAVRTDDELREIDRFEIRCRLLPHVVPAPDAMRVNRSSAARLVDQALPTHYQMVRKIREQLQKWSPSLFLGWNSIRFDEDLLRQAFYKTLHAPYLTNTSGNSRSDALRLAQACSIHAPGCLKVPVNAFGHASFALHATARENGLNLRHTHDAMADVEATLFLCRQVYERAAPIWSTFMRFATKAAVIDYLKNEPTFCVSTYYGGKPYSSLATAIQQSLKNKAEWIIYDLSVTPDELRQLSQKELMLRVAEPPYPVRRLKPNGAPIIFPSDEVPAGCRGSELNFAELQRRADLLRNDPAFAVRLVTAYESGRKEYPPSPHVEQQIYDRFPSKADEALMETFHSIEWIQRSRLVDKFEDPRLQTIGRQLIHLERPDALSRDLCREHDLAIARRLLGQGDSFPWLTLPRALEQLETLRNEATGDDFAFWGDHEAFLRERHRQVNSLN